ncbi:MAG: hypothetical protein ACLQQ4_01445 [Bacteroidia bacterium]
MKTKNLKLLLLFPSILFLSCKGQMNKGGKTSTTDTVVKNSTVTIDTANIPKYKVNVNKRYDSKGNMLMYDSSYSYSYSSPGGMGQINDDSVYSRFKSFFHKNYSSFFNSPFNDIFYQDSLFKYDFFNNDYFSKRFEMNNDAFAKFYRQMDSVKDDFMRNSFPNGQQKRNNQ